MVAAFDEKLNAWQQFKYGPRLKESCDDVIHEFERRFRVEEEEIKQEGDKEATKMLKEAAYEALSTIEGPLKQLIDEFEAYEKGVSS